MPGVEIELGDFESSPSEIQRGLGESADGRLWANGRRGTQVQGGDLRRSSSDVDLAVLGACRGTVPYCSPNMQDIINPQDTAVEVEPRRVRTAVHGDAQHPSSRVACAAVVYPESSAVNVQCRDAGIGPEPVSCAFYNAGFFSVHMDIASGLYVHGSGTEGKAAVSA